MKRLLLLLLFVAVLFGCKPESEPSCYEPSSLDKAFLAWDGVNIGDSLAGFIAKYPDTFDFSPCGGVNHYRVKSIVLLDGLRWEAEVSTRNQQNKAVISGISLTPTSWMISKDATLPYRESALGIMKTKGRPKYSRNPRTGESSGRIKWINDGLTKNVAFLRVCNGASFLLDSYGYTVFEDTIQSSGYVTTFTIYDGLYYTPSIISNWPDYFSFINE